MTTVYFSIFIDCFVCNVNESFFQCKIEEILKEIYVKFPGLKDIYIYIFTIIIHTAWVSCYIGAHTCKHVHQVQ